MAGLRSTTAVLPRRRRPWAWLAIAATVALTWFAGRWFRPEAAALPGLQLKRLTADHGLTTNVAISPDGRLIAYASDRAGNGDLDIWVQLRGSGDAIRITHGDSDEFHPAFSADGAQIVYASGDGIYLVPALGGQASRLTNWGQHPSLSPDGKRLVYQNQPNFRAVSQISLLEIGSSEPRVIAQKLPGPSFPVWSPDGKYLWEKTYEAGCDRSSITQDGKKIYVPTGWWYSGEDSGVLVVNAENGELIKRIRVGPQAHNSVVSLDGRYAYLCTNTMMTIFDAHNERIIRQIKDVGEFGIFPYTMDSRNRIGYVCLGKHVGFDVVDLEKGKVLHRVYAGEEHIPHRTHGVALKAQGRCRSSYVNGEAAAADRYDDPRLADRNCGRWRRSRFGRKRNELTYDLL